MPIYEYQCLDCHHAWDVTEHIAEHTSPHNLRCPRCGSDRVEQMMTEFFAKTSKKS